VNGLFLGLGLFLVFSAVLGFFLVKRRERIEQLFTVYSSAGKWEQALPHAILLARLRANPETLGRRQQNLGNVFLKLSRWEEAREAFERALATQLSCEDPYAGLVRANIAWLELRAGRFEKAREQASAIAKNAPPEIKPRAAVLEAASYLVENKPEKTRELLESRESEFKASKKPGDAVALDVLAAAIAKSDEPRAVEIAKVARGRMPDAQRREFVAMVPFLAGVLGG